MKEWATWDSPLPEAQAEERIASSLGRTGLDDVHRTAVQVWAELLYYRMSDRVRMKDLPRFVAPAPHSPEWLDGRFFDPAVMRLFRRATNEPTGYAAKAVVVEWLLHLGDRSDDVLPGAVNLLERACDLLNPAMRACLRQRLHAWGAEAGMPGDLAGAGPEDPAAWRWLRGRVDWAWVADRLQEECLANRHRAEARALELAVGESPEGVERRLGGFEGTFEEKYLRLTRPPGPRGPGPEGSPSSCQRV
jgi:hypothetical protein